MGTISLSAARSTSRPRSDRISYNGHDKNLPLGAPPLGECPKDKGGAASGEEKVSPKVTDEGTPLPIDVGLGGVVCLPRIEEMIRTL